MIAHRDAWIPGLVGRVFRGPKFDWREDEPLEELWSVLQIIKGDLEKFSSRQIDELDALELALHDDHALAEVVHELEVAQFEKIAFLGNVETAHVEDVVCEHGNEGEQGLWHGH